MSVLSDSLTLWALQYMLKPGVSGPVYVTAEQYCSLYTDYCAMAKVSCALLQGVQSPLVGQVVFRSVLFGAFGAAKRWLSTNKDGTTRTLTTADFYKVRSCCSRTNTTWFQLSSRAPPPVSLPRQRLFRRSTFHLTCECLEIS